MKKIETKLTNTAVLLNKPLLRSRKCDSTLREKKQEKRPKTNYKRRTLRRQPRLLKWRKSSKSPKRMTPNKLRVKVRYPKLQKSFPLEPSNLRSRKMKSSSQNQALPPLSKTSIHTPTIYSI